MDIVFLLVVLAFFGVAWTYVHGCGRL